jgi:hypothetical protein
MDSTPVLGRAHQKVRDYRPGGRRPVQVAFEMAELRLIAAADYVLTLSQHLTR